MGVDEEGHLLLVSNTYTNDKIALDADSTLKGYEAYEKGPALIDDICNKLYATEYGTARNMKISDVNKLLGYTKNETYYKSAADDPAWTSYMTIGELEEKEGASVTQFVGWDYGETYKNLMSASPVYDIKQYSASKGYGLVACGTGEYWLSTNYVYANLADGKMNLGVKAIFLDTRGNHKYLNTTQYIGGFSMLDTSGVTSTGYVHNYRPVIELNTYVILEENAEGVWEIVE